MTSLIIVIEGQPNRVRRTAIDRLLNTGRI